MHHHLTHPQTHHPLTQQDDDEMLDLDYMTDPSLGGIRGGTVTGHRRQRYTAPSVTLLDSYMTEIESRGSSTIRIAVHINI